MPQTRTALQELSKCHFGQIHRLSIMLAIADSETGRVNPTDLSDRLRLPQSALQTPLRDMVDGGLLKPDDSGFDRRNWYIRQDSRAWDWVRELDELAKKRERSRVRDLRSAAGNAS